MKYINKIIITMIITSCINNNESKYEETINSNSDNYLFDALSNENNTINEDEGNNFSIGYNKNNNNISKLALSQNDNPERVYSKDNSFGSLPTVPTAIASNNFVSSPSYTPAQSSYSPPTNSMSSDEDLDRLFADLDL